MNAHPQIVSLSSVPSIIPASSQGLPPLQLSGAQPRLQEVSATSQLPIAHQQQTAQQSSIVPREVEVPSHPVSIPTTSVSATAAANPPANIDGPFRASVPPSVPPPRNGNSTVGNEYSAQGQRTGNSLLVNAVEMGKISQEEAVLLQKTLAEAKVKFKLYTITQSELNGYIHMSAETIFHGPKNKG